MNKDIYEIAFECKKIADQQIEVIRTIITGDMELWYFARGLDFEQSFG